MMYIIDIKQYDVRREDKRKCDEGTGETEGLDMILELFFRLYCIHAKP
jgi:hypothetical protein